MYPCDTYQIPVFTSPGGGTNWLPAQARIMSWRNPGAANVRNLAGPLESGNLSLVVAAAHGADRQCCQKRAGSVIRGLHNLGKGEMLIQQAGNE